MSISLFNIRLLKIKDVISLLRKDLSGKEDDVEALANSFAAELEAKFNKN